MVTNSLYTLYAALVSKQVWQLTDQCLNNYGTFPKKPADAIIEGGGGGHASRSLRKAISFFITLCRSTYHVQALLSVSCLTQAKVLPM